MYHKRWLYDVWFMRHQVQQFFFVNLGYFCPIAPLTTKKSKFWKNEKTPGYIFTLHKCTINYNHMFGSWDMKPDRQNFSVLLGHLLPFYPTNNPKNQNFEKMKKKTLEVSSCYTCEPKIMIIFYTVPEIWSMTDVIFIFHFGIFFAILAP